MITLTIDGKSVAAQPGDTILEAAKRAGIDIPNLCYLSDVHKHGSCRICVVEVEGAKNLQPSCLVTAHEGMVVHTCSRRVRDARKVLFELMISDHSVSCLSCKRNQSCELQALGRKLGVNETRFVGILTDKNIDSSVSITRDMTKCVLCRRCVTVCNEVQGVGILNPQHRGFKTVIGGPMNQPLGTLNCAFCGQCTVVCPVGALKETDSIQPVWKALADPKKRVVVQVAPAVRVAIGEIFGVPGGTSVTGKLAAALRRMGFNDVFDTNFTADLTILEEGTELLSRLKAALTGGEATLPMITSCSPGWIKYVEHHFPEELDHLSSCKSPHTMLGALVKSYYAQKIGVDPKDIFVVSVMPCTAKKFEIERSEMRCGGHKDVDAVITTRECAQMFKEAGIDFAELPEERFDAPMGLSTGAADIFGLTGGVMEAALRTVFELVTGRDFPFENLHVEPIVGFDKVKSAEITFENVLPAFKHLEGVTARVAVTSGLSGAKQLLREIATGASPYHFIEVMGCPGGCIMGGGQPRSKDPDIRLKRMKALYGEDEGKHLRKSHENPDILTLYKDFLEEPGGHISHSLLHTHYLKRDMICETPETWAVLPARQAKLRRLPREDDTGDELTEIRKEKREQMDSEKVMSLHSENIRVRDELKDALETIDILKKVISDSKLSPMR